MTDLTMASFLLSLMGLVLSLALGQGLLALLFLTLQLLALLLDALLLLNLLTHALQIGHALLTLHRTLTTPPPP